MQLALLPRELSPATVLHALQGRLGRANGLTAEELCQAITGEHAASDLRRLRSVIEQLRREGNAVCASPRYGYYLAASAKDLDDTCAFLLDRALTSIRQIAAMKRVAMPDLRGQLGLPLEPSNES